MATGTYTIATNATTGEKTLTLGAGANAMVIKWTQDGNIKTVEQSGVAQEVRKGHDFVRLLDEAYVALQDTTV
jgi:3-hydroxy-3-methylglutaryl CoA synthase